MISQRSITFPDGPVRVRLQVDTGAKRPCYSGEIYTSKGTPIPFDGLRLAPFKGEWGLSRAEFVEAAVTAIAFMGAGCTGDETSDAERARRREWSRRLGSAGWVVHLWDENGRTPHRFRELPDVETSGETCTLEDKATGATWRAPMRHEVLPWQARGLSETRSGYGSRLRTTRQVLYRGRWHRVYCTIWSNSGTCWIRVDGKDFAVIVRD